MSAEAWLAENTPGWLMPSTIALSLTDGIVIIAQAGLIANIAVEAFVGQRALVGLMPGMWLLLAVLVLRAVLGGVRQRLAAGASAQARFDLRQRLLAAIATQGPVRMGAAGSLMTTFDEQVEALDAYYARYLPQRSAAMAIPPLVVMFVLVSDWLAGLLLLMTAPLIPLFMILIGIGARDLARRQFRSMARLGGWFMDQVRGAATIRLFQAEARVIGQVSDRTAALRRETMRVLRLAFLSSAVLEFFSAIAIASVAIYIGLGLLGYLSFGPAVNLTLGSGLFVLLLAPEFFQPIRSLSQGWHDRADAHAAVDEIRAVINQVPARPLAAMILAGLPMRLWCWSLPIVLMMAWIPGSARAAKVCRADRPSGLPWPGRCFGRVH
ncbi:MAG: hypothetical protein LC637_10570 [Xanthomonadaceae bacterium]|nr:hypothetical protein [Xanthomonadaceae bacterium]